MGLFHLTACLLIESVLSSGVSLLQTAQHTARQGTFSGLRFSPQDPAARTLLTLDTNHDARIDQSEVAAYARLQNLDASAATQEFSSIDLNSDGTLDSAELQQVLGATPSTQLADAAPAEVSPAEVTQAEPAEEQLAILGQPSADELEHSTASVPKAVQVSLEAAPVAHTNTVLAMALASKALDEGSVLSEATATQATGNNVDVPAQLISEDAPSQLISEDSRNSLQKAATSVAEALRLEEKEEQQSRDLDRKAAKARTDSIALIEQTKQDALDAGVKVARAKTTQLLDQMAKLEDKAERAELRAAALRAKSKMEVEEGQELMAAAKQALTEDIN